MARAPETRKQITLKHAEFGPEFKALLNKAAARVQKTQADYVYDVLSAAARRTLAGELEHVAAPPVAVETLTARQDATEARLSELTEELRTLTALQRRSLWARIWSR